jgi:hypothetical protein
MMNNKFLMGVLALLFLTIYGCQSSSDNKLANTGNIDPKIAGVKIEKYDVEDITFLTAVRWLEMIVNKQLPEDMRFSFLIQADPENSAQIYRCVAKKTAKEFSIDFVDEYAKQEFFRRFFERFSDTITLYKESTDMVTILNIICFHYKLKYKQLNPNEILLYDENVLEESTQFPDNWIYDGSLHKVMLEADRIVIRDGGMDCCNPVDDNPVLCEIKDCEEIKKFIENLNIENYQTSAGCGCCGWPGIDFYKGKKRIALTSIKHGGVIWWRKLPSEANLTKGTREWLRKWCVDHGVPEAKLKKYW